MNISPGMSSLHDKLIITKRIDKLLPAFEEGTLVSIYIRSLLIFMPKFHLILKDRL